MLKIKNKKKIKIIFSILIFLFVGMLTGCIQQQNNTYNDSSSIHSTIIAADNLASPIYKYFSTKKIIWTFDDYWIHVNHHPPHKGFDGLSQQIHSYGGNVNIMCPFIPPWIGAEYRNEIRNYSVVEEFSKYHLGFTQDHINHSLDFFNRSYISVGAHGWNHSADLGHANLNLAYKLINYTLWNWYNNYKIKPSFWLGHNSDGNYNITVALKDFSQNYWTVYGEAFRTSWKDRFPNGTSPAVESIGDVFDPYFGCTFGHSCKTLQEAQQLFTKYSENEEIIFIRGHPSFLNDSKHKENLSLWQDFIDWIYQNHTLININHTQAIEYKIDRNNFRVEKYNEDSYSINLTLCQFNHTLLFSTPDGKNDRWILHNEFGEYNGEIKGDTYLLLEKNHSYILTRY